MDRQYREALSFYNRGEYEKALELVSNVTFEEGKLLAEECRNQITRQYTYLIKDAVKSGNYSEARALRHKYKTKFDPNPEIESIIIPDESVYPNERTFGKQASIVKKNNLKVLLGIICIIFTIGILIFVVNKCNNRHSSDFNLVKREAARIDAIRKEDSIAAIEAMIAAEEESHKISPFIFKDAYYEGDMAGYPITMNICVDENQNISGKYKNVKYGTILTLSGKQESGGLMNITASNKTEKIYFTLSSSSSNTLDGYGSNGSNKLNVHLKISSGDGDTLKKKIKETTWNHYHNQRFGFDVTYPSFLDKVNKSDNGDGCTFYLDNETYLIVSGINNVMEETLSDWYEQGKQEEDISSVVYNVMKNNWFVISGYTNDGRIFYRKTYLGDDVFIDAILYFPSQYNEDFKPIIKKVFNHFPN